MSVISPSERALLAQLADVLIPATEGFPSGSEAGVGTTGLNQVLQVRPELRDALVIIFRTAQSLPAAEAVNALRSQQPAAFDALGELVAGAYFLNEQVRAQLGYFGQTPRPIDPRSDDLDEALLRPVIDRGPIHRPTPS